MNATQVDSCHAGTTGAELLEAPAVVNVETDVGAKSGGIDRYAHRRFEGRDARAVDQETSLLVVAFGLRRASAKACPAPRRRAVVHSRRARGNRRKILQPACIPRLGHPLAQQYPAVLAIVKTPLSASKRVCNCASFLSRISMMKWIFDSYSGLRIEGRRAERDRKAPILRQAFAWHQRHAVNLSALRPFTG